MRRMIVSLCMATLLMSAVVCHAAEWGLKEGTPDLKSAGPMVFGPDGIVFVGDTKAAAIFAIDTGDASGEPAKAKPNVEGVSKKLNALLGSSQSAKINDLAVNPLSGNVYLSVTNGEQASLVKIDGTGKLSAVSLKKVKFAKATLPNPPESKQSRRGDPRDLSITDLAFIDGKLIVAGLTSEKAASNVRELAFPFAETDQGTSIEIYHGAHGKFETGAVVRTFVPFNIDGEPTLLASFQCTPLVKFPLKSLKPGKTLRGTTIAELGNRNRPLDMIAYKKDGKNFLLVSNSSRGVMKVSTEDIDREEGIEERVKETAGQSYETIKDLAGVVQLDKLNDDNAVVLVQTSGGSWNLKTIELP